MPKSAPLALLLLCLVAAMPARAAVAPADSLPADSALADSALADSVVPYSEMCGGRHTLRPRDVIIPAAVVGFTAFTARNGWLRKKRDVVQDALSPRNGRHTSVDDYIQYAPSATVFILNAVGVHGRHRMMDRLGIHLLSFATMTALTQGLKHTVREKRPDSGARNSFPSGHTATAFMGAELLRLEYADVSPWIGYAGYAVAATTAYLRIYNNRHYLNDVLAGAAIGIFSSKFAYWLYPRLFRRATCRRPSAPVAMCVPYAGPEGWGASLAVTF